jgi:hypothetical protein
MYMEMNIDRTGARFFPGLFFASLGKIATNLGNESTGSGAAARRAFLLCGQHCVQPSI